MTTKKYTVESAEVDLENEDVRDSKGRRIDQEYVKRAVDAAHEHLDRVVGRPSLTAPGARSPQVTFRLRPEVKELAEKVAKERNTTVSTLAREAFERYLAS
jgi:hypothetical protein